MAIGQNSSYINRIENQRAFPPCRAFFISVNTWASPPGAFLPTRTPAGREGVAGKFARLTPAPQALVEAPMDQLAKPRNRRNHPRTRRVRGGLL